MIANPEITALLTTAKASARMIAEDRSTDLLDDGKTGDAAYDAIVESEKYGSAVAAAKADAAAIAWVNDNEAIARRLIQRRIDVQAARLARRGF